jgi:hypothetical protein
MPDSRPSDLVGRFRGTATGPAAAPASASRPAPPQSPAAGKPPRTKFTMLLDQGDVAALDEVTALLSRQLGRRRVDRSEALRGLMRLARRDLSLLAQLAEELSGGRAE